MSWNTVVDKIHNLVTWSSWSNVTPQQVKIVLELKYWSTGFQQYLTIQNYIFFVISTAVSYSEPHNSLNPPHDYNDSCRTTVLHQVKLQDENAIQSNSIGKKEFWSRGEKTDQIPPLIW